MSIIILSANLAAALRPSASMKATVSAFTLDTQKTHKTIRLENKKLTAIWNEGKNIKSLARKTSTTLRATK